MIIEAPSGAAPSLFAKHLPLIGDGADFLTGEREQLASGDAQSEVARHDDLTTVLVEDDGVMDNRRGAVI